MRNGMKRLAVACVAVAICGLATAEALYTAGGPVQMLDGNSLKKSLKQDGVWLVEFYAPWCGHCKSLAPEWEKSAQALQGLINVAAVDVDANREIAGDYGIQGFPTIKAMIVQKGKVVKTKEYKSDRTAKSIAAFALEVAQEYAELALGAKLGGKKKAEKSASKPSPSAGFYAKTDVVELTSDNFKSKVVDGSKQWFVEFYAPWCGHCKALKSAWLGAAKELKDKVNVGAVNCDDEANKAVCSEYGIRGFPTLKYFGTDKSSPKDYKGARDQSTLVDFAVKHWEKTLTVEVDQLVTQATFDGKCSDAHQLCFIAFLPDVLDSKAEGRNAYLNVLKDVGKVNPGLPYSYLWAVGGTQANLESNFGVGGFGYPALVAFSPKKKAYALLKGSFTKEEVTGLLQDLRSSKVKVQGISGTLASIQDTAAWDGKDAPSIDADEPDLEDIMKDEI